MQAQINQRIKTASNKRIGPAALAIVLCLTTSSWARADDFTIRDCESVVGQILNFFYSSYIGIDGRSLVDGDTIEATLLGQSFSFKAGGEDDVASAFAGMHLSLMTTNNFAIHANLEGALDTEQSSLLKGNISASWKYQISTRN